MSEKKIVVPEGMLKAAHDGIVSLWNRMPNHWNPSQCKEQIAKAAIEAALRWLSENPIVPTDVQAAGLGGGDCDDAELCRIGAIEWQRRMFLASEPEVPEAVKVLLLDEKILNADFSRPTRRFFNDSILEAYRRGKESK